jgi:hypothetical protein
VFAALLEAHYREWPEDFVDGWVVEDHLDGGLQFDNGVCAVTMLAAYQQLGDRRYLDSARRACEWTLGRPIVANWNYNAFSVWALARFVQVTGDRRFAALFAARCAKLGTRLIVAENGVGRVLPFGMISSCGPVKNAPEGERPPDPFCPFWLREDIAIALAVTRALGISDVVATRGMERAAPDPGAAAQGHATLGGREIGWIDATAANDPESLDLLADEGRDSCRGAPTIHFTVYNHRFDRAARLATFAASSRVFRASAQILLTGDRPSLSLAARVRRLCPGAGIRFVGRGHVFSRRLSRRSGALRKFGAAKADRLLAALEDALARQPDIDRIIFCGNTRGFARPFPAPVELVTNGQPVGPSAARSGQAGQATNDQDQRATTND